MIDLIDRKILQILQTETPPSIAEIAQRVGLSTTPCWRRIQKLEEVGIIRSRVALLDAEKLNVGVTVFVSIRTDKHDANWYQKFSDMNAASSKNADAGASPRHESTDRGLAAISFSDPA